MIALNLNLGVDSSLYIASRFDILVVYVGRLLWSISTFC
jgi:hypothetical protein